MQKNAIVTTDKEVIYRKSKSLPNKKSGPKKIDEGQIRSKSDTSKLMALQDALQDPITHCERF